MAEVAKVDLSSELYETFKRYKDNTFFNCAFCYDEQELAYFSRTPIRHLSQAASRKMLWETGDHWESVDAYKTALPRILEILGPPFLEEDLYPTHLFETLHYHGFNNWPEAERLAVIRYLNEVSSYFSNFDESDWKEWNDCMAKIGTI